MRVLVTGASGTIGRAVCDALLARGDEVVGLTRNPEAARATNPTVSWHPWNPALERPPGEALEDVDGIINLVGEPINQRWTDEAKERILVSRETATRNLVHAMLAAEPRPRVLVNQSAVGYYGNRGDALVDEETGAGETFDARVCVAWEAAAREVEGHDIRLAIMRTGLVLDKDSGLLSELLLPFKLGVGGPVAGGQNFMPWISLADEVGLLLWALDNDVASGVYNATAPEPVTNKEFSKALGAALGRPAVMPVPKLAVKLRLGSELGEVATGGQRALPRRAQDQGYEFRHPDIRSGLEAALA
ncbi:MAG TPA: TIGR01777 family oxidoreductase [Solirubrobacterales bacterium]|nr:TIGR01777 family oxidoreductase [Solirubrobacterales bacterium]